MLTFTQLFPMPMRPLVGGVATINLGMAELFLGALNDGIRFHQELSQRLMQSLWSGVTFSSATSSALPPQAPMRVADTDGAATPAAPAATAASDDVPPSSDMPASVDAQDIPVADDEGRGLAGAADAEMAGDGDDELDTDWSEPELPAHQNAALAILANPAAVAAAARGADEVDADTEFDVNDDVSDDIAAEIAREAAEAQPAVAPSAQAHSHPR